MRILFADDHILFRDTLDHFIRAIHPDWTMDNMSDLSSVLDAIENNPPHYYNLVMVDYRMPGMNGIKGIETLVNTYPDQKIAIISGTIEEKAVFDSLALGVCAYFPKTLTGKSLVKAIELVLNGERFVPLQSKGANILPSYQYDDQNQRNIHNTDRKAERARILQSMTAREKEVLEYVAQGLSNKEIARALNLQIATIKLHVSGICKKLNAANRTRAAILAHHYHLVDTDITLHT